MQAEHPYERSSAEVIVHKMGVLEWKGQVKYDEICVC